MTEEHMLGKRLRESVIRAEIATLQKRLDALAYVQPRVARARRRYIREDFAKLERVAQKWNIIPVAKQ